MGIILNTMIECGWIYSMSKDWKSMENSIRSHLFVMLEHLVKVYYYHNYTQYIRGWANSIKKGFEDIGKVSLGNKKRYPSKEKLYKLIVEDWGDDDIDKRHRNIIRDLNDSYKDVPPIENIDSEGFMNFFLAYCDYLCTILSQDGGISAYQVKEFIDNYF